MKKILFTGIALLIVVTGYIIITRTTPIQSTIPSGWLTYSESGITFSYPKSFGAYVWKSVTWPPKVTLVPLGQNPLAVGCPRIIDSANIISSGIGSHNGTKYTFAIGEDLGAGQRYSTFCYVFSGTKAHYVLDFDIQSHIGCSNNQCGAYCNTPFEQECRSFDMTKDVILPIETIISTCKIKQ